MAPSHDALFEETQISSTVTETDALRFYEAHGIFYQENAAIGKLRDEIRGRSQRPALFDAVKAIILQDPVGAHYHPFVLLLTRLSAWLRLQNLSSDARRRSHSSLGRTPGTSLP